VGIAARLNDRQFNGHRVRRIPHPLDDAVDAVITAYRGATPSEQRMMLDEMNKVAVGTLCTYPERLAERDVLRLRHGVVTAAANGKGHSAIWRDEVTFVFDPARPAGQWNWLDGGYSTEET
jgi:hypothetical protein